MQRDSTLGTIMTAAILCVVCSVIVSASAVGLKSFQDVNKKRFEQRNILEAAGYTEEDIEEQGVEELFKSIETQLIDLTTGEIATDIDEATFDQKKAAKDPELSVEIPKAKQTFGFDRHEKYSRVYLMKEGSSLKKVIIPIYGKGLWSTLYGFISLEIGPQYRCRYHVLRAQRNSRARWRGRQPAMERQSGPGKKVVGW